VAGALLAPGLTATAGNLSTGEGALSALSAIGEVVLHNLMHSDGIGRDAKDLVVEFHSTDFCAGHVQNFHGRHSLSTPFLLVSRGSLLRVAAGSLLRVLADVSAGLLDLVDLNGALDGHQTALGAGNGAADDPRRLAKLTENRMSLLAKYGYTEQMAKQLCATHGLLSPIYTTGTRGGCWFCPNCKIQHFVNLRRNHPELWAELVELSHTPNLCSYGFKYGLTVQEVEKRMNAEEQQLKLF